ncbi:MAG TPA: hypothetical protein PLU88_03425 [Armatimonadota bacterium]|jgi:hypothetical protein|nr:hypothetical protein [Armatimonadota bacterium]HOM71835.1 hypothetical protein [Armatimonadota bacterium]HPP74164.1 hypothetical protein [Armatimonadota bacterium]
MLWQIWLCALLTLGIYTFLYSDNKLYRMLLNILIGLNVGYQFMVTWKSVLSPKWWALCWKGFDPKIEGSWFSGVFEWLGYFFSYIWNHPGAFIYWLILGVLGSLWYFQLTRKYLWLSRIVIGMSVGMGAGIVFKSSFLLNAAQITDSFRPFIATMPSALWSNGSPVIGTGGTFNFLQSLNNVIFVGTIVCVMVYFFFSFSHENRVIVGSAKMGRWLLMISFGAFFGNTVMTRMAVFLERLQYLIRDWAIQTVPQTPLIAYIYGGGVLLLIIAIYLLFRRPPAKPQKPDYIDEEGPKPEVPVGEQV